MKAIKNFSLGLILLSGLFNAQLVFAEMNKQSAIQQAYSKQVDSGKDFKDAYAALAHEIAYETAAVQSRQPCRKMIRGL